MEPKLDQLDKAGFSPDYVYRETKRSVASAAGKTKIYPGIGFDVPWGSNTVPADPEKVYQPVIKAFEAGANGIVVSREYEEMRVPNLRASGGQWKRSTPGLESSLAPGGRQYRQCHFVFPASGAANRGRSRLSAGLRQPRTRPSKLIGCRANPAVTGFCSM